MFSKNSPLSKKEATVVEVIKYLKAHFTQYQTSPASSLKDITNDSQECTLALKVINEKLSCFIQHLATKSIQKQQQSVISTNSKMAKSIEDQKLNRDKLTATYGQQVQFYEQEQIRLEQYLQKLSASNYEGHLTSEIINAKTKNHELAKEINENKLKLNGMMARREKQLSESRVDRNDDIFRLNYLETKIVKTITKNEAKETWYHQLEQENTKLIQKIGTLKGAENLTNLNLEIDQIQKVKKLKQQIEKLKKGNEQTEERTRKCLMNFQLDNEKHACENQLFKKNIVALSQTLEEQHKIIKTEEDKIGLSISHLKEFIFRERALTRDKLNKSQVENEAENSIKKNPHKALLTNTVPLKKIVNSIGGKNNSSVIRRPLNNLENGVGRKK